MTLMLGIHMGHDAGVCVVEDGRILAHLERERHTRVKHAAITEVTDIDFALKDAGRDIKDVDFLAVTSTQNWPLVFADTDAFRFEIDLDVPSQLTQDPSIEKILAQVKEHQDKSADLSRSRIDYFMNSTSNKHLFTRKYDLDDPNLSIHFSHQFLRRPNFWTEPFSLNQLMENAPAYILEMMDNPHPNFHWPIKAHIRGCTIPGAIIPHHMAHAANAFYQSDLEHAGIMTYDGSVTEGAFGLGQGLFLYGEGNRIFPIIPNSLSPGNLYMRVATQIGFGDELGGPGKLMGLAPYGKPRFFDPRFVGNIHDHPTYLDAENTKKLVELNEVYHRFSRAFLQHANVLGVKLGYGDDPRVFLSNPLNDFCKDLAASTQRVFEEQTLMAAITLFQMLNQAGKPMIQAWRSVRLSC